MRKIVLIISILLFNVVCLGQISFEEAYYITNQGERISGYIEFTNKSNNPENFKFKPSKSSSEQILSIDDVSEVVIRNRAKYIRAIVPVNISSIQVNNLVADRRPNLVEKKIFLYSLVEGRVSLFQYLNEGIRNYYIKEGSDRDFELLIYKKFRNSNNSVGENKRYQQQLLDRFSGNCIDPTSITKLQYRQSPFVKIITAYNNCNKNPEEISESSGETRKSFQLNIRPRVNYNSVSVSNNDYNAYDVELDEKVGFGLGLEAEFILPFFQNKWSLVLEPTFYQKYEPNMELLH
ncbi:hypothetical protein INR75_13425 [Zunongwangia sp. SCSIO 43204]|uniref:hypothetical protein n=1 Tax=Zunongwangia sp. SCSIO 43204 TaxID=2779359 RepID=UPI001CA8CA6A|nr:hypothetical protein [Zunongwangia sp. SCSIO 43204]UAB83188.1 hypothetical protein INR75_13425 [Zunongwangia sp. SCSIO 43204]